ncbi:MAG: hypothetical protein PUD20_05025 [bacterium]|nr:hypothetical protein [bacterium]
MAKNSEWVVEGFQFDDIDLLHEAKKEAEGVRYVRERMDFDSPEKVLKVYDRMLEQNMFRTPVGQVFLREVQDYLYSMPQVANEQIHPIQVKIPEKTAQKDTEKDARLDMSTKRKFRTSVIINVVLAAMIVVMFAIALSSSHPTILNYENKLIDRYSEWEHSLEEREQEIRQKERELNL